MSVPAPGARRDREFLLRHHSCRCGSRSPHPPVDRRGASNGRGASSARPARRRRHRPRSPGTSPATAAARRPQSASGTRSTAPAASPAARMHRRKMSADQPLVAHDAVPDFLICYGSTAPLSQPTRHRPQRPCNRRRMLRRVRADPRSRRPDRCARLLRRLRRAHEPGSCTCPQASSTARRPAFDVVRCAFAMPPSRLCCRCLVFLLLVVGGFLAPPRPRPPRGPLPTSSTTPPGGTASTPTWCTPSSPSSPRTAQLRNRPSALRA